MQLTSDPALVDFSNPLELMEQIAASHEWVFARPSDRELAFDLTGHWCDYRVLAAWHDEAWALHFHCAFDIRIPEARLRAVTDLLALINPRLLVGHFDLWSEERFPVFRHSVLLRGVRGASVEQLEDLIEIAYTECERFFPAFQFVVWAGKSPAEALASSMFETVGEA